MTDPNPSRPPARSDAAETFPAGKIAPPEAIPLDRIVTFKLLRDRRAGDDPDLPELVASIRDTGLSNPIRVEDRGDGRFELIQGFRRLAAFRALLAETGDAARFGRIPASRVEPGAPLDLLYRRMVDENLVRKGISLAEMARLALDYAADPGTAETDPEKAVAQLFRSAGYQKRSYIRAFLPLVEALGDCLDHAPEIPRALGLKLAARLAETPGLAGAIRAELAGWSNRSVADELGVLRRHAGAGEPGAEAAPAPPRPPRPARGGGARTIFQVSRPLGRATGVAADGRLEIRLDRDFSRLDRDRLEAAVRLLLDQLG